MNEMKAPSYDEIFKEITGRSSQSLWQPNKATMQKIKDEYDRRYALYLLSLQQKDQPTNQQSPVLEQTQKQFRPTTQENAAIIQRLRNVLPVVGSAPTYTPKNFLEQFAIYSSGGTFRLYVYTIDVDTGTGAWKYVALT
jgi:hypothetical protein